MIERSNPARDMLGFFKMVSSTGSPNPITPGPTATTVSLVAVGKLHAITGEDCVDFVGHYLNQNPQNGSSSQLGRLAVDLGEPRL